jgi:signal transduction histidine kinase
MSQAETGNIQLKMQPAEAAAIVETALGAVIFNARQKNIGIHTNINEGLPMVNADIEKTSRVLINFLTNAIRYSHESATITIHVFRQGEKIHFEVADNGIGIDEKYVSRVFDRYFKMPGNTSSNSTGLGLAISKEFIEAQGGSVNVTSELDKGSTFSFSLRSAV